MQGGATNYVSIIYNLVCCWILQIGGTNHIREPFRIHMSVCQKVTLHLTIIASSMCFREVPLEVYVQISLLSD